MAIKNLHGKTITANQYAKWLIFDKLQTAYYFTEAYDAEDMTQREIELVLAALEKQEVRLYKLLGMKKIMGADY